MMHPCLMCTDTLNDLLAEAKMNGCDVTRDKPSGTACAWDISGDGQPVAVIKAMQKGHLQPWIVTFQETDRVKWVQKTKIETTNKMVIGD